MFGTIKYNRPHFKTANKLNMVLPVKAAITETNNQSA